MIEATWQLHIPVNAIIFDCDSTLSSIEGIDELAIKKKVHEKVKKLTEQAMGKTGLTPEIYQERLALVQPTLQEVIALGQQYIAHQVLNISKIMTLFQRLNKAIYIVSAGLYPSIIPFGDTLGIHRENIFAVDINFDAEGRYTDFDKTSPLVYNDGKRHVVANIKASHSEVIYVGDGLNDMATMDLVRRFIGYGGVNFRENIAEKCQFYINTPSMAALLPLSLIPQEYELLTPIEKELYQQGKEDILQSRVLIK